MYLNTNKFSRLPLELIRKIALLLEPPKQRNRFFRTTKSLYAHHITHCRQLQTPNILTIKLETKQESWETIPIMTFNVQPDPSKCPKVNTVQIYIRTLQKPIQRLLLPFSPRLSWGDHRAFCSKEVRIGLISTNDFGSKLQLANNKKSTQWTIPPIRLHYYCWNGDAQIHMHDGSTKHANEVTLGDALLGASGAPTIVKRIKETAIGGDYKVVDMGDFVITRGHPIRVGKEWYRPDELFEVSERFVDVLYNFYAEPEHFVVVGRERVVCSSLGGYCPRLAEMDPVTDVLYGRGYGSREAEEYKWLLALKERIPDEEVCPRVPDSYDDLYPGREDIVILGRTPLPY